MNLQDFQIHSVDKLDRVLAECCGLVLGKQAQDPEYWGMVGACLIDSAGRMVYGVNHRVDGGRDHAEVVAIKRYLHKWGDRDLTGSIIVTTLSPCSTPVDQPDARNCTDYIERHSIKKVYCGWSDPTQNGTDNYRHKRFHVQETRNPKLRHLCMGFAKTFIGK